MRVPLAVTLESRDGGTTKDAKNLNSIAEVKSPAGPHGPADIRFRKRPGSADLGLVKVGTAQFLFNWNGINAILADHFLRGTITTIVSGPTDTNLSPANASLMFTGAATNNNAATPRLFYKSRTQQKVVNRAGTHTDVTYASNMGAGTYSIITLTRSGATATATVAEDFANVGDTITIAGASDAAYNGAKTVTAITAGSVTPAVDIPLATLTRVGTTAGATTSTAHGLSSTTYTISGANDGAYNGAKAISVTSPTSFTYTVTVTPATAITWDPGFVSTGITLSVGNLKATDNASLGSAIVATRATAAKSTGKWYWEVLINAGETTSSMSVGVASAASFTTSKYVGETSDSWGYKCNGDKAHTASAAAYGATYGINDVVGVAWDADSGTITFYKNGVSQGQAYTSVTGTLYPALSIDGSVVTCAATANFGATAFTYTAPTGYNAYQSDDPITPATGTIVITKPAATVNPTFSYTVAGTPATPDAGATKTAASNGGTVPGITYINGYFSVMDLNGVIWTSASDDPTTWDALDFVTAQFENGAAKALVQSANMNVALKEWSTEYFYDRQDTAVGSPFSPVNNGFTRIGCASGTSYAYVGGGVAWLAQTKQEGRCAYWMVGTEQQRISTPDVDRILNTDDLATVHAYGIEIDGHPVYVLTLVTSAITLIYDLSTKQWGQWSSYTLGSSKTVSSITRDGDYATATTSTAHTVADGDPVLIAGATQNEYNGIFQASYVSATVFKFKVSGSPTTPATTASSITAKPYTESYFKYTKAANYNGGTYFLHESDGHLYQMQSSLKRDAGLPINWFARTTRMDGGSTGLKRMASLEIVGDSVTDVAMLRWSDDDCATFSAYRFVDLSADRPNTRKLGAFRRRTVEFRHVGNTNPVIAALEMEIG